MAFISKRVLSLGQIGAICLFWVAQSWAGSAKDGQGSMNVSPTAVYTASTTNYVFTFRTSKSPYNPGSQATLQIPAGWSAPQTSDASGPGYVTVTPVLGSSTASLSGISGSGPWTLSINFSTSQNHAGFTVNYGGAVGPTNAGVYTFVAQTEQSGGNLRRLRSGSPTITVDSFTKTNTTTLLSSGPNPSTYGDWVTFTAIVSGGGNALPTGTVTFKEGDVVLGTVALDASAQATFSTNRFVVPDSPCSITAEYNGDSRFNAGVSAILLQTVNAATLSVTGLGAQNKAYDGGTGAVLDFSAASLSGALAGDDVGLDSSSASASFGDPDAAALKSVTLSGLALLGADSGNYVLDSVNGMTATIFPAPLTVTANNTNRFFGDANPAFTASYSGFVAGENAGVLSGAPAFNTTAGPASPVGGSPYAINVTSGTLTATNYTFGFVAGQLTIVPKPAQPQRIVSVLKLPDGTVSVNCSGAAGQTYFLQACPDCSFTSWTTIATNTTDASGLMSCMDPTASNIPRRFYRTALP